MKKVIKFALSIILVLSMAVCCISASAAANGIDAVSAADALHELGLLQGVGTNADGSVNFALDNSLTRAQSITQVVRFLGAEKDATGKTNSHPFTDLAQWAVPYISYAYANGITQGVSATKFDGDSPMSDYAFLTAILRVLGYKDSEGDFVWNNPYELANEVGLIRSVAPNKNFKRGDAFVICYNALTATPKSGATVAEGLIAKGLFTAEKFDVVKKANEKYDAPSGYAGLEYDFDVNGNTFYSHYGTWEKVSEDGEDFGALHLTEGKGILLAHDIDYTNNVTISAKVKIAEGATAGNFGFATNAWWNESGEYDKNWIFYEGENCGYFYAYLSGARSAGMIGKYDGGTSINNKKGWETLTASSAASYGMVSEDIYNAGTLANVEWALGKYYDYSCTWNADTNTLYTMLEGELLYSVEFDKYPLSVIGNDFGFRSNISNIYLKDIVITVDDPALVKKTDNSPVLMSEVSAPAFTVEKTSTVWEPESRWTAASVSYGAIEVLEHSGNANGTIFTTMNAGNISVGGADGYCYKILKSTDGGVTWTLAGTAKDDFNTGIGATYAVSTPCLYELPADVGDFKAGTLLLAGVSKDGVKTSEINVSAITLFYSTDLGATWTAFATIDKEGGENAGVWEPFLMYDGGRVYCFYSDDSDLNHSQKVACKWSDDLVNWVGATGKQDCTVKPDANTVYDDPIDVIAFSNYKYRPGMPSVAKMNNGKYIIAFELVGKSGSPVYCKVLDTLDDFGDVSDLGKMVVSNATIPGTSPWITYTHLGGECGTVILSAHKHATGSSLFSGGSDYFISQDYGNTWTVMENPIPYEFVENATVSDTGYYRGYSPKVLVSGDGKTLYCLNVTENIYNANSTELKFASVSISGTGKPIPATAAYPKPNIPAYVPPKPIIPVLSNDGTYYPNAYAGKNYQFDIGDYTFYSHSGTWEIITEEGEDFGAMYLSEGKGMLLTHDVDFTKNVTVTAKVKYAEDATATNIGFAMNAWWNENDNYNANWSFFEGANCGYFFAYLSGARSAGLIGKYDGGTSSNGNSGWQSFSAANLESYGIPTANVANGGEIKSVAWELGKYYDVVCVWDAENKKISLYLENNLLYSVMFPEYPLSVEGDDFGFRCNVSKIYIKDIRVSVDG